MEKKDSPQTGPPSTREHVGNVDEVESRKEVIDSNVDTKEKKEKKDRTWTYLSTVIRDSTT